MNQRHTNCSIDPDQRSRYILGELDASAEDQLRQHLDDGCEVCHAELQQLDQFSNLINRAAEDVEMPAQTWASIRPDDTPTPTVAAAFSDHGDANEKPASGPGRYGFILATACSFFLASFVLRALVPLDAPTATSDVEGIAGLAQDGFQGAQHASSRLVSMRSNDKPSELRGSFLVDWISNQIHLFADGWQTLPVDQRFVVWFVTADDSVIEGDHLDAEDVRSGLCLVDVPETDAPLAFVAVTVEQDDDWSNHQKQPVMASGSMLKSARFVSDAFSDPPRRKI